MRPDFLVIGCGKCGTSSLCALLDRHPEVFITRPKEPNFLSRDEVYARGWSWYESLFEAGREAKARGEGSVSYTVQEYEERVVKRLAAHLPDVRLIYMARDPLARIESVYREHHTSGPRQGWLLPFNLKDALDYRPAMITNTRYWERLGVYRDRFPDDRILVLFLEDMQRDAHGVLSRCFEFLGVDPAVRIDTRRGHLNRGTGKYYDTRLLRALRKNRIAGGLLASLPTPVQRWLERPLRRRFTGPIDWPEGLRRAVLDQLRPDALRFLRYGGKPDTFWPLHESCFDDGVAI